MGFFGCVLINNSYIVTEGCQFSVAPQILTPTRRIKVRAGFPLNFEVEFIGSPDPSVDWKFKDCQNVPPELIIDNKEGKTNMFIPSAKRAQSGNYTLSLKNEIGKDEGVFEINVQGNCFLLSFIFPFTFQLLEH